MASWLPIAKAILPYVSDVLAVVKPVFTKKHIEMDQMQLLQKQVAELQSASLQNMSDIQSLAEQLKTAVPLLEQEILMTNAKLQRANLLCVMGLGLSVLVLIVVLVVLL